MLDAATSPRIHTPQRDTGPDRTAARTPSGNRWHVVYTHPQAERRAVANLTEQGYATYLPIVPVRRRDNAIRSLLHTVLVPLFPRYLFVQFDAAHDPWMPIVSTLGVRSLLRRPDGTPEPCRAGAVEAVQAAEQARREVSAENAKWAPGAAVALRRGYAMEGLPAVVLDLAGNHARISVMFLGQLRQITVNLDCLTLRGE